MADHTRKTAICTAHWPPSGGSDAALDSTQAPPPAAQILEESITQLAEAFEATTAGFASNPDGFSPTKGKEILDMLKEALVVRKKMEDVALGTLEYIGQLAKDVAKLHQAVNRMAAGTVLQDTEVDVKKEPEGTQSDDQPLVEAKIQSIINRARNVSRCEAD